MRIDSKPLLLIGLAGCHLSCSFLHPQSTLRVHSRTVLIQPDPLWKARKPSLSASSQRSDGPVSTGETESNSGELNLDRRSGLLVLFTVPFAWGTFEPAVRYVYSIEPQIPGFVFTLFYYMVAAFSLTTLALIAGRFKPDSSKWPILGGLELGSYLFVGNALQVLGLKTVQSDRAAFLLQLTTIFVPLMEAALASNVKAVSLRTWAACAIALSGVGIMGLDEQEAGTVSSSGSVAEMIQEAATHLTSGDALIIAAAIAYTFHCIRLEGYAQSTSAVKLAASKATTETVLTALAVVGLVLYSQSTDMEAAGSPNFGQGTGSEILSYFSTLADGVASQSITLATLTPAILAITWTGLVTCAYTIYAQSYGQSRVRPVTANLIYTIQPICTALFAWVLLGESLGPAGYVGGTLIGLAVLLVATPRTSE